MEKKEYFHLALKQGGVTQQDAVKVIALLSEKTLYRITQNEFDRRLIRPVLAEAKRLTESSRGNSGNMELEEALDHILDNKVEMFRLMKLYCLEE